MEQRNRDWFCVQMRSKGGANSGKAPAAVGGRMGTYVVASALVLSLLSYEKQSETHSRKHDSYKSHR
jgi:hypothetical protein